MSGNNDFPAPSAAASPALALALDELRSETELLVSVALKVSKVDDQMVSLKVLVADDFVVSLTVSVAVSVGVLVVVRVVSGVAGDVCEVLTDESEKDEKTFLAGVVKDTAETHR